MGTAWDGELERARARFAALEIDVVAMMSWREESPLPLVAQNPPGWTTLQWSREERFIEQIDGGEVVHAALEDGRVARVVAAGRRGERVELIRWDGDAAVRSDGAALHGDGTASAFARTFDGERVRHAAGGTFASVAEALEAAAALEPGETIWDGRTQRPEPWPDDPEALIEPLARALYAALHQAAGAVEAPFCLEVRNAGDGPLFPPFARLAGVAFRDRMRRASANDGDAIEYLFRGEEAGDVVLLELGDALDADALRACRALSTALEPFAKDAREAGAIADAVGERLADLLNATPFPGAVDPFVALVHVGNPYGEPDALDRARRTAGDARVDAFRASVTSLASRGEPDPAALTDREALERHLAGRGLQAHARRLAHEVAQVGMLLEPGDGPSHLGGPPELPPGEPWPTTAGGEPLVFLAAIETSTGRLLFFAAYETDEIYEAVNEPGSPIRVLHAAETVPADGPALQPRPLTLRPVLTLPDGHEAPEALGLDVYEGQSYQEALDSLARLRNPGSDGWGDEHWFGGLQNMIQGYMPEPGTVLLLHISWDEELGFEFADGGMIQFRIPADALEAGDWSRIVAEPDSC
jgi:hypothetical protein